MTGRALTLPETAERLNKTPRWLVDWLRAHPVDGAGIPYCRKAGRTRLFTDGDVVRITLAITGKSIFDLMTDRLAGIDPIPPAGKQGDVYFIAAGDFIKIGFTTSPVGRVKMLRTNCPWPLEILHHEPGTKADERAFHERFSALRMQGEWFTRTPELLAFIAQRKKGDAE